MIELNICEIVAQKLGFKVKNVYDSLMLIDQGATVPFVARYRKEVTGGISDVDLNHVIDEYHSLENFISRRNTILKEIESQGKLTEDLKNQIMSADSLSTLEDLYRPYKPKKVTRGSKAKKAGLEPLAEIILMVKNLKAYFLHLLMLKQDTILIRKFYKVLWTLLLKIYLMNLPSALILKKECTKLAKSNQL